VARAAASEREWRGEGRAYSGRCRSLAAAADLLFLPGTLSGWREGAEAGDKPARPCEGEGEIDNNGRNSAENSTEIRGTVARGEDKNSADQRAKSTHQSEEARAGLPMERDQSGWTSDLHSAPTQRRRRASAE
jgi:hypothetical protein